MKIKGVVLFYNQVIGAANYLVTHSKKFKVSKQILGTEIEELLDRNSKLWPVDIRIFLKKADEVSTIDNAFELDPTAVEEIDTRLKEAVKKIEDPLSNLNVEKFSIVSNHQILLLLYLRNIIPSRHRTISEKALGLPNDTISINTLTKKIKVHDSRKEELIEA